MRATLLGVIGLICVATTAQGQLVGLNQLWTVSGAMQTSGAVGTFVSCTNKNTSSETIGIDFYGANGSYITPGLPNSITVAPDATVIMGTSAANGISVDVNYASGIITKGHALIFSSATKGIVCSAFLADQFGNTPVVMVSLTIAKKTKQKGD